MRLLLLPGLDGTGRLFAPLLENLPPHFRATVVAYPSDEQQSYVELTDFVRGSLSPNAPYLILAESFSGPIAVRIAATAPPNLQGLVLCASFVSVPVNSAVRSVLNCVSRFLFLVPPPRAAIRYFLAGDDAPDELVTRCVDALSSVSSSVLSHRLRMALEVDERQALGEVSVPVLYLLPTRDRVVSNGCVDIIRALRTDVTIAPIDSPHLLLQREPIEALKEIEAWMRIWGEDERPTPNVEHPTPNWDTD